MGNPKKKSRFICLKCCKENYVGAGIQRESQREKWHIKDLTCLNRGCNGSITKNLEIRYCDDFIEMYDRVDELHNKYYGNYTEMAAM